jgi:hypothetical protein
LSMRSFTRVKKPLSSSPLTLLLIGLLMEAGARAQTTPVEQPGGTPVTPVAVSAAERLLPDSLAGLRADAPASIVSSDRLSEIVADQAEVYREYRVTLAGSREYSGVRVEIFETKNQFGAFGLFTYTGGDGTDKPISEELGPGNARIDGDVLFWKANFFVRVGGGQKAGVNSRMRVALARAIADAIAPASATVVYPPLLESLPRAARISGTERYFLGPESLNAYAEHGRGLFEFAGDTEAVIAEYQRGASADSETTPPSTVKLVIVECHTPQFATDAMRHAEAYASSLSEEDRNRLIIKRTGNYVVAALGVRDHAFAQSLLDSIEYPYTVKWLRNPLWPTNDPFHAQKAAQMLLSTFGLLGLILLTVLAGGAVFGTTIFLKRRKRQRGIFSDAGGMLRLELDPFESVILGLPPKRSEE